MGFFSWKASDTGESIRNRFSTEGPTLCYLLCPDGNHLREDNYEGYGVFGGLDVYVWWLRTNRPEDCAGMTDDEIRRMFFDNDFGFKDTDGGRINCEFPIKLATEPMDYEKLPASQSCEEQGYFDFEAEDFDEDPYV